jgi:hypothetical protein
MISRGNDDPNIVQSGIDLMPKERLGLLLHLTEQLCHQDFIQAIKSFIDVRKQTKQWNKVEKEIMKLSKVLNGNVKLILLLPFLCRKPS